MIFRRGGIATKIYLGLGGAVVLTALAGGVAWTGFVYIGDFQRRVGQESIPAMSTAFSVADASSELTAAAARLRAALSQDELAQMISGIGKEREALDTAITRLNLDSQERFQNADRLATILAANLDELQYSAGARLNAAEARKKIEADMAGIRQEISGNLLAAIDNEFFYLVTGIRDLSETPVSVKRRLEGDSLFIYRDLLTLEAQSNLGSSLLAEALGARNASEIQTIQERFNALVRTMRRAVPRLGEIGIVAKTGALIERMEQLGNGPTGAFAQRRKELQIAESQSAIVARHQEVGSQLVSAGENIVIGARIAADEATMASQRIAQLSQVVLVALIVLAIVGAVLIGWLFVGRVLVRRLLGIAESMRQMAGGDLEVPVAVNGQDEITDMSEALEVFRRHALEVQRLNLVEKLATEVQDKNVELEGALSDLKAAQDQIVVQEKLAALGQLTAGVAHEIKNPLNFVNNFSELSVELTGEIREIHENLGASMPEEIRENAEDLVVTLEGNLSKIREHGQRADRIVNGMLSHTRDEAGQIEDVDVNILAEEYMNLAYHGIRARDPEFNIALESNFSPEAGTIRGAAQDLSRVILNLATNACYAVNEKRAETKESDYRPVVHISTAADGDMVKIVMHDNGSGISEDAKKKIFQPFFTTKPTGEGTGLGLSMVFDIVRRHGGDISVDSVEGEYTEMTVSLPRSGPINAEGVGQAPASAQEPATRDVAE